MPGKIDACGKLPMPVGITGHHWASLGIVGIVGMPAPHFIIASCAPFLRGRAGMPSVFLDCIPKCLPQYEAQRGLRGVWTTSTELGAYVMVQW